MLIKIENYFAFWRVHLARLKNSSHGISMRIFDPDSNCIDPLIITKWNTDDPDLTDYNGSLILENPNKSFLSMLYYFDWMAKSYPPI